MTIPEVPDPRQALLSELRWFVHLRFVAGGVLLAAVTISAVVETWSATHTRVLLLAAFILSSNILFWWSADRVRQEAGTRIIGQGWLQVGLDLLSLTLLVTWTGGMASPLLWLFLLHMVFTSILLPPHGWSAYIAAGVSIVMLCVALWMSGAWPELPEDQLTGLTWAATLLAVSYLANHITGALRQEHQRSRDQHQLTRAILHTAADGIITIDAGGVIQSTNPAAEVIFGYRGDQMTGQPISMLMAEPDAAAHQRHIERYLETGDARIIGVGRELQGRRADGTLFPLEIAVSEVRAGKLHVFTGIVRDITARRAAESKLRELNEALVQQQKAMIQHEKMVAMGRLTAGITHEIANPLASIDSVLQLVQRNPDRFSDDTVSVLREQVERIRKTMSEMTAFAHPNETSWEAVALNDVVRSAVEMVRFDHRIRGVAVEYELDESDDVVTIMPNAIRQVLVNLILNALDAMEGAAEARLTLRTVNDGDEGARVEVEDTGLGIDPEHHGSIFDPFFTTKPAGKGTGLGLSISYSLVKRHGGRLEVRSASGQGACFAVLLPRQPDSDPREADPESGS